jgi:hypothetical protein
VATPAFLPVSFPAREPGSTVMPPAAPDFGATARSDPAPKLLALETTSPSFGAMLAIIQATASAPSGHSTGVAPTTLSSAVPSTLFAVSAVSSDTPDGHALGVSLATPQVTPEVNTADADPATSTTAAIGCAQSDATGQEPHDVLEHLLPVDLAGTLGRCWQTAGAWVEDLVHTEVPEAADLVGRLAPFAAAAGLCFIWRSSLQTGGRDCRLANRRLKPTTVC